MFNEIATYFRDRVKSSQSNLVKETRQDSIHRLLTRSFQEKTDALTIQATTAGSESKLVTWNVKKGKVSCYQKSSKIKTF